MPLLAEDYDIRFGNVAHPSLHFEEHVAPGEPIHIAGMSLHPLTLQGPAFTLTVSARYSTEERVIKRPAIDLLLVMPEARTFELVARATIPLGRSNRVLSEVVVRADD